MNDSLLREFLLSSLHQRLPYKRPLTAKVNYVIASISTQYFPKICSPLSLFVRFRIIIRITQTCNCVVCVYLQRRVHECVRVVLCL